MAREHDIFISYSHKDSRFVKKLEDALKRRGLRAWTYERKVLAGENIVAEINSGLSKSRAFGIVVSSDALKSKWVIDLELGAALNLYASGRVKSIIPICLDHLELPPLVSVLRWVDFSEPRKFEASLEDLVRSLKEGGKGVVPAFRTQPRSTLHELILSAKENVLVSGLTLDKFTTDPKVRGAVLSLLSRPRPVEVRFLLLNPHSLYAKAHELFHPIESRSSATAQIEGTIRQFEAILQVTNRPREFSVYMTSYMPRFRAVVIDDDVCHVNLYMYGTDVLITPELVFRRAGKDSSQFE